MSTDEEWTMPFAREDWQKTPPAVRNYIVALHQVIAVLQETVKSHQKRIEELEARLNRNSSNSSRPPSSDPPFRKEQGKGKGKPGGKKGHKGHRQAMLDPTEVKPLKPERCSCGNTHFPELVPYYTHQFIELPEIRMEVTHFVLHKGTCPCCGKVNKKPLPSEYRTGFGPGLCAMIAQLAGNQGDSRTLIQEFCNSVLGFPISLGAIQKIIDRSSAAIAPHYEAVAQAARASDIAHIDETTYSRKDVLQWLWVMATSTVAFFMIHRNRSRAAFEALVKDWDGILVSDGYRLYCNWVGLRQTCLAHLIRDAKGLCDRKAPEIAQFGAWALAELQRLCHMARAEPTRGEWSAFYARLIRLITRNRDRKDDAGRFARRLERELDSLWLFLAVKGVEPTNNHAERMLRFAVTWRKRSQGTASEKGNQWVERILSLRQTCRLQSRRLYPILVDAISVHFQGTAPSLTWIQEQSVTL